MKGSYILLIELNEDSIIKYGIKKNDLFNKGYYVYVGSALNNLEKRIQRHIRSNKKKHWNIDFFLDYSNIINVYYKENNYREECFIAGLLKDIFIPISNFGSSDCKCKTHLFYVTKYKLKDFLKKNKMKEYKIQKT
jgi:Uri superfamily endonuclease